MAAVFVSVNVFLTRCFAASCVTRFSSTEWNLVKGFAVLLTILRVAWNQSSQFRLSPKLGIKM